MGQFMVEKNQIHAKSKPIYKRHLSRNYVYFVAYGCIYSHFNEYFANVWDWDGNRPISHNLLLFIFIKKRKYILFK